MKLFYSIIIFIIFFCNPLYSNNIEYIEVKSKGNGTTYSEALNNALSNAIAQVNGRSIETQTSLKKLSKAITTDKDSSYYSSKEFEKTIKEMTEGFVSNFKILSEDKSNNNVIKINISANIGKYKIKKSAKRKRIAVLPFYFTQSNYDILDKNISSSKIDRLLTQSLVSYLVQTRKFTVLDREYMKDIESELSLIKNNETNIEETVKLGQKIFSDYILVGTIENFYTTEKEIKIKNSNNSVMSKQAFVEFNYRILDVPTSQIMYSDDYRGIFNINNSVVTSVESEIINLTSLEIGSKILYAIYPLRIEKMNGNLAYIGQGGKQMRVEDEYNIIELGEKINSSYTNEYIGREETIVGKLRIIDVGAKISTAEIIEETYSIEENFEPKKFIIKLIDTQKSDIENAKEKIKQKKKENKNDDDW
tara:strand:- start:46 stop:1305 length:1260 start_codon:yes stop_codon:yes gene_type:complete